VPKAVWTGCLKLLPPQQWAHSKTPWRWENDMEPEKTPIKRKPEKATDISRKAPEKPADRGTIKKQKIALVKRNEKPKRLSIEQININFINRELEYGKEEVLSKYTFESEKEKQKYLFYDRCKILKPIKSKNILSEKFFQKHWPEELDYLKNNKFPLGWMEDNPEIGKMCRKHKPLMMICNLLRNAARNATESQKENMVILSKELRHRTEKIKKLEDGTEKVVMNNWPVFCFKTNEAFYKKLSDKIGCSPKNMQRYILAMTAFGMLKKVNYIGKVNVLSFGFWSRKDGRDIFHHWVTKATFKDTLKDFQL
jgi:hypothetical protein